MLVQLLLGSAIILFNMALIVGTVSASLSVLPRVQKWLNTPFRRRHKFLAVFSTAVLLVLFANSLAVWVWGTVFYVLSVFPDFETALYFATASYTTVGYGDVISTQPWRLLSSLISVNGLFAFGIITAFLFEVMRQTLKQR